MAGELSKWRILALIKEEFLHHHVNWITVFGPSGSEALLVTHRGEVFALGTNGNCCLGLGVTSPAGFHPKKVEKLSCLNILHITYGIGPHVLALTQDGSVYSWGGNGYGQLGHGCTAVYDGTPKIVNQTLSGVTIVKIACGGFHSMALSINGEVFAWGFNNCGQLGTGDTTSHYFPTKVTGSLDGKHCQHITCSHAASYTLTSNGELFSWGQNGSGQLGIGTTYQHLQPCMVPFFNIFVKKVVAGYSHVLALSESGDVYTWGANSHGQLGNGAKQCLMSPCCIGQDLGKTTEVAAVHLSHISAAVVNNKVYIWGECYHQNITTPLETQFSSTDEVFACLSSPACTWRPYKNASRHRKTDLSKCIEKRFNDPDTSDLLFVVEGHSIYVHKAILRMRSNYFYSMLQNGTWKEGQMDTFEITDQPYVLFKAFLSYLYTDKVDLPNEDIPGLLELADCYCESDLKQYCEQILTDYITVENVIQFYILAVHHQAKDLEDACFNCTVKNSSTVILSNEFSSMEDTMAKTLVVRLAKAGAFKS